MLIYTTNQIPFSDEIDPKNSIVCMYGDISNNGSLRKELAMATLKKRRGSWYARVLWYDNHGRKKEKQVPLRTKSKVAARERLGTVNKDELEIKLTDNQEALLNLRIQKALQQLEHPQKIRSLKREIAQIKTVIREYDLSIRGN